MSEAQRLQAKGVRLYQTAKFDESLEAFNEAATLYRDENDTKMEAEMLVNAGLVYSALEQYPQAIDHMERGLATFREKGERLREAQALGNLGQVYAKQEDFLQASQHYQQAAELFQQEGNQEDFGHTIMAMADAQFKAGDLEGVNKTFETAMGHVKHPATRQKMEKQLLVVKSRLAGQKKLETQGESDDSPQTDRRRRRARHRKDEG